MNNVLISLSRKGFLKILNNMSYEDLDEKSSIASIIASERVQTFKNSMLLSFFQD